MQPQPEEHRDWAAVSVFRLHAPTTITNTMPKPFFLDQAMFRVAERYQTRISCRFGVISKAKLIQDRDRHVRLFPTTNGQ